MAHLGLHAEQVRLAGGAGRRRRAADAHHRLCQAKLDQAIKACTGCIDMRDHLQLQGVIGLLPCWHAWMLRSSSIFNIFFSRHGLANTAVLARHTHTHTHTAQSVRPST